MRSLTRAAEELTGNVTQARGLDHFTEGLARVYPNLAPVPLANNVIRVLFGQTYAPGAQFLHYVAGMIA